MPQVMHDGTGCLNADLRDVCLNPRSRSRGERDPDPRSVADLQLERFLPIDQQGHFLSAEDALRGAGVFTSGRPVGPDQQETSDDRDERGAIPHAP